MSDETPIHMTAQVEQLKDVLDDHGRALLKRHHAEIALDQHEIEYAPDWARYEAMDKLGQLSIVTLRSAGTIVGYCVSQVLPELHYKTTLAATMDILWLDPEFRGHMGGLRLMRAVERELRRRGVKRVYMGSKLHKDISPMLRAMGYVPVELWFYKLLRKEET